MGYRLIGSSVIEPNSKVRNLGVFFDSQLNMETHITNVCKSSFHMIYNLRRIRKYFHWLPVRQRISFKILLIVYKALIGQAPSYISELLQSKVHKHTHNLRSSNDTLLLQIPTCKTKISLGDQAFALCNPKIVE